MKVIQLLDADEFLDSSTEDYLRADVASHCVPIGILDWIKKGPEKMAHGHYFAVLDDNEKCLAFAMKSYSKAPWMYSASSDEAMELLLMGTNAHWERDTGFNVCGVGERFKKAFLDNYKEKEFRKVFDLSIYALTKDKFKAQSAGSFSLEEFRDDEKELLARWSLAFQREALPHDAMTEEEALQDAEAVLSKKRHRAVIRDDDGKALAMVARTQVSPVRISWVYTPQDERSKGYSKIICSLLAEEIFASGEQGIYLYADQANPTSNKVYQSLGFEVHESWSQFQFVPSSQN